MVDAWGTQTSKWVRDRDASDASRPKEHSGDPQGTPKARPGLQQELRSIIDILTNLEDSFKEEEMEDGSDAIARTREVIQDVIRRTRDIWTTAQREDHAGCANGNRLDRIEASLRALQGPFQGQKDSSPSKRSWAAIAAQADRREEATRGQGGHKVRVRPTDGGKGFGEKPQEMYTALRQVVPGLIAVRPLKSGDIDLHLKDQLAKDKLLNGVHPTGCKVLRKDYLLEVPGVPLDLHVEGGSDGDNSALIKDIKEATGRVAPGVAINRIRWLHGSNERIDRRHLHGNKKTRGTLIIGVPTQAIQHQLIRQGLIIEAQLYYPRLAESSTMIKQCFKCSAWGHMQNACGAPTACGQCAGAHDTRECTEKGSRCGNCGKKGHRAWQRRECPSFRTYLHGIQAKQAALREQSARLREAVVPQTSFQGVSNSTPSGPQGPSEEGFTVVGSRKRGRDTTPGPPSQPLKRGPGRPRRFAKQDDDLQASILQFTGAVPTARFGTSTTGHTTPVATQASDDTPMSGNITPTEEL